MTKGKSKRAGAKGRRAEFPAREPEAELLRAPAFDPGAGAAAAIGCVVTLKREGADPRARYTVVAIGSHRIRVVNEGEPSTPGAGTVVPRAEVASLVSRPERKGSSRRPGPKALRVPADAESPVIADLIVRWCGSGVPAARVLAALKEAVERLGG